jgi:hypothetical protein
MGIYMSIHMEIIKRSRYDQTEITLMHLLVNYDLVLKRFILLWVKYDELNS